MSKLRAKREEWPRVRIADIAEVFDGPHATPKTVSEGPIFLGIGALQDGSINLSETRHVTQEDFLRWTRRVVPMVDDFVFSYETRVGEAALIPEGLDCCLGRRMGLARLDKRRVDPRFFLYQYRSPQFQEFLHTKTIHGATVDRISIKEFPAYSVFLPSLDTQRRITDVLDEALAGIASAEQNTLSQISALAAVFASELDSTLSTESDNWKTATLSDVCQIARGGSPRPIKAFLTDSADGINWVKISDATASAKYVYKTEQRIVPAGAKRSRMVHDGDFLLSNSMSFGRPYIMKTDGCIHDGWLVLSDYQKSLDQDFLYLLLGSRSLYQQFDRLAAGSTVRNLNKELASRVIVRFPDLEQQKLLAKNLEHLLSSLEDMKAVLEKKLTALIALRQSFLHQAFSGKL